MNRFSNETNRILRLKQVPQGIAGPDDFEVAEAPVPEPGAGELLIRTHYTAVDAALRLIVRDSDEFLFRVKPGDPVFSSGVGEIVASNHPDFSEGEFVLGHTGVQNFALSNGDGLERVDTSQAPLHSWLGSFGVSGLTAFFAMYEECKPQPGQTVLVNGAAGAVGSMAGQFAKLAGARVIGLAGKAEKCRWLTEEVGFDVAINYRDPDWYQQLEAAAPDRLDVIFDNVGGEVLDESLRLIGMRGCVLLCGSTSQYPADEMRGPSNYIWLGTMRARLQGFVVFDYEEQYPLARQRMAQWVSEGKLKLCDFPIDGDVGDFPAAFQSLYEGVNRGRMSVRFPAAQ